MGIARWIATGVGIATIGAVAAYAQYRDIEKPAYEVVIDEDGFELRQYAPMVVAQVTHTGTRRQGRVSVALPLTFSARTAPLAARISP